MCIYTPKRKNIVLYNIILLYVVQNDFFFGPYRKYVQTFFFITHYLHSNYNWTIKFDQERRTVLEKNIPNFLISETVNMVLINVVNFIWWTRFVLCTFIAVNVDSALSKKKDLPNDKSLSIV